MTTHHDCLRPLSPGIEFYLCPQCTYLNRFDHNLRIIHRLLDENPRSEYIPRVTCCNPVCDHEAAALKWREDVYREIMERSWKCWACEQWATFDDDICPSRGCEYERDTACLVEWTPVEHKWSPTRLYNNYRVKLPSEEERRKRPQWEKDNWRKLWQMCSEYYDN